MPNKDTTPLISKTAFSCPHCGAYTTQYWFSMAAFFVKEEPKVPAIPKLEFIDAVRKDQKFSQEENKDMIKWAEMMLLGKPFFNGDKKEEYGGLPVLHNCHVSKCYNCEDMAIWIHDQIVYPNSKINIQPNNDLAPHIKQLYEEAREIVGLSPKGAAALLRLCVQYLCKELGEKGKNIDDDIASLVMKGLNPLVQQALDVVRVVGNSSVHPGEIDLNDNKETAIQLFGLVNLICDQMITHPKKVKELYGDLPLGKLEGIERRNEKAKGG